MKWVCDVDVDVSMHANDLVRLAVEFEVTVITPEGSRDPTANGLKLLGFCRPIRWLIERGTMALFRLAHWLFSVGMTALL
eukprot:6473629-Amphidinium_carterae.2